jgi:hypothetical protein
MFSCLSAAAQEPDAILTLHTTSVAAGVGYSWGGGLLTFQGKEYSCRIDGLAVGEVGISSAEAIGNVYHLTTLADFSGTYTAVGTGGALGGGGSIATMCNSTGWSLTSPVPARGPTSWSASRG